MYTDLRFVGGFILSTSIFAIASPLHAQVRTVVEDAKAFGARESARGVSVSPDGKHVVILMAGPGASTLAKVFDVDGASATTALVSQGQKDAIKWCQFASNTALVCKFGGNLDQAGDLIGYSRLVRVDLDGKNLKPLGQSSSAYDEHIRQFDGSILDWMPDSENQVLMAREYVPEAGKTGTRMVRSQEGLGVDRVDIGSVRSTNVEPPRPYVSGFATDDRGNLRLRYIAKMDPASQLLTGQTDIDYRPIGTNNWKRLGSTGVDQASDMDPLAVEASTNSLYYLRKLDGRQALYRMPLDGTMQSTLVAKSGVVDIDDVVRVGRGQKVIGYTFADETRHAIYFDKDYAALAAKLATALPGNPGIDFVDASKDSNMQVIMAASDTMPGTYYLLDQRTKSLSPLMNVRPALDDYKMSTVKPVSYKAKDGTVIPAYLTLPASGRANNLPAIVMPHGGPSARDEWGFDWLAQFLAARGYAVIQPNYRGSSGYGDQFENENGFKNWRTSISDVNDAAEYLVGQGIADPKRLAILGWSYGGYAALQSAITAPGRYKAVVAIAPVTDLGMVKEEAKGYTNEDIVAEFVGNGEHIESGSPLRHASDIKVPVLLAHGDLDSNVGVNQSAKMADALRAANSPVEFLRYPNLDHQLDDSNARVEMLTKIGELLDRTIGH